MPKRRKALRSAAWWHDYFFGWVKEPRTLTYLSCLAYALLAALTGLSALLVPPTSITHHLGPLVTTTWGGLILVGGVLAIAGCLPGWWWLERVGIVGISGGLVIYALVVISLNSTSSGNRLPQTGAILVCLVFMAIRWLRVRGAFADPRGGAFGGQLHSTKYR